MLFFWSVYTPSPLQFYDEEGLRKNLNLRNRGGFSASPCILIKSAITVIAFRVKYNNKLATILKNCKNYELYIHTEKTKGIFIQISLCVCISPMHHAYTYSSIFLRWKMALVLVLVGTRTREIIWHTTMFTCRPT